MSDQKTNRKRYMLFSFDTYYPGGGSGDVAGTFATKEEAIRYYKNQDHIHDWGEILDLDTGKWEDIG